MSGFLYILCLYQGDVKYRYLQVVEYEMFHIKNQGPS